MTDANTGGTDAPGSGAGSTSDTSKTFTQEELDRHVGERLARERAKYADYEELRKKATEFDELRQSQMSETEKLQKRLADLETRDTAWQTERQELLARSAITEAARAAGAVHPDAVFKLVDFAVLEYGKDGKPTNVEAAVAELAKQYPALFRAGGNGSADGGARKPTATGDMNSWLAQALRDRRT